MIPSSTFFTLLNDIFANNIVASLINFFLFRFSLRVFFILCHLQPDRSIQSLVLHLSLTHTHTHTVVLVRFAIGAVRLVR